MRVDYKLFCMEYCGSGAETVRLPKTKDNYNIPILFILPKHPLSDIVD